MKFQHTDLLESFLDEVDQALMHIDARREFKYPRGYPRKGEPDDVARENAGVLDAISHTANLYAIFTAEKGSADFKLRYIGKTKRDLARSRIRSHLIKRNEGTGAKLENVLQHIESGGLVAISWIQIEPESLRNYLEEALINRHGEADWNKQGRCRS